MDALALLPGAGDDADAAAAAAAAAAADGDDDGRAVAVAVGDTMEHELARWLLANGVVEAVFGDSIHREAAHILAVKLCGVWTVNSPPPCAPVE